MLQKVRIGMIILIRGDMSICLTLTILVFIFVLILSIPVPQGYCSPKEPAKYAYQYTVKDDYTNNNFGQAENRDGYSAQGEYFVNLPDGRLQKVSKGWIFCSGGILCQSV